jgi:class 3 adenylate cyclase
MNPAVMIGVAAWVSPAVRVGRHHGAAIERDGDYFGATVNLARARSWPLRRSVS